MNGNHTALGLQFGQGDRAKFFVQLEFMRDPEPNYATPEEAASWGRFQIWVGGRNLCLHYVDGVQYEHVTWRLLPLLEWLANDWDYILHEQRYPVRNEAGHAGQALRSLNSPTTFWQQDGWNSSAANSVDAWVRRHSLQLCRDGGLFPDVWLRRLGEKVEVSWTAAVPVGAPRGFQFCNGDGCGLLAPGDVAEPLYAVLRQAALSLRDAIPHSKRLNALVTSVEALKSQELAAVRVGILAGLGRSPVEWQKRWEGLCAVLSKQYRQSKVLVRQLFLPSCDSEIVVSGDCSAALMFAAVSPSISLQDELALAGLLIKHSSGPEARDALRSHTRNVPLKPYVKPWEQGYALAQEWSEIACLGTTGSGVDIEKHLLEQGVKIEEISLSDETIGAVAMAGENRQPVVAVNGANPRNAYPSGRRFTLAHELCHLLYDRRRGVELQFASGEWAPAEVEMRANAFAAGLLMPDSLVQAAAAAEKIRLPKVDQQGLTAMAKRLNVSPDALSHHLVNRCWIKGSVM